MLVYPFNIFDKEYLSLMKKIGVSEAGISIMKGRFALESFVVSDISTPAANVV